MKPHKTVDCARIDWLVLDASCRRDVVAESVVENTASGQECWPGMGEVHRVESDGCQLLDFTAYTLLLASQTDRRKGEAEHGASDIGTVRECD